jgi:hypothetical protein
MVTESSTDKIDERVALSPARKLIVKFADAFEVKKRTPAVETSKFTVPVAAVVEILVISRGDFSALLESVCALEPSTMVVELFQSILRPGIRSRSFDELPTTISLLVVTVERVVPLPMAMLLLPEVESTIA